MIDELQETLKSRPFWIGTTVGLAVIVVFVLWVESDPEALHQWLHEDGPVETATAFFFALSSLGFLIFMKRSTFLRSKGTRLIYFFTVAWALLMFVFVGEEISWGQRIFEFSTPQPLADVNLQGEFNIHNIGFVDTFLGGKYRYLSIMMILTGFVLPLLAHTPWFRGLIQRFAFPVAPLGYWPLFLGAYIFGKYYASGGWAAAEVPIPAAEVREFLLSLGMFFFAFHGVVRPPDLFYLKRDGDDRAF